MPKKSLYRIFVENMKNDAKKKLGARNTYEKAGGTVNFTHKDDLLNKKAKKKKK